MTTDPQETQSTAETAAAAAGAPLTHHLLNYLYASYQGRFAWQSILAQLDSAAFNLECLLETRSVLEQAYHARKRFEHAELKGAAEQGAPNRGLIENFLRTLQPELSELAETEQRELEKLAAAGKGADLKILIATYARTVFAQDAFVRGSLAFAKGKGGAEDSSFWKEHLENVRYEMVRAKNYMRAFSELGELDKDLLADLQFVSRTVPGALRTNVHDIELLCLPSVSKARFEDIGVNADEALLWNKQAIDPQACGYWRAHAFLPGEAGLWRQHGVQDALIAAEWKTAGFRAEYAARWITGGFSPFQALHWFHAEYTPEQAHDLVQLGFDFPDMVPRELIDSLLGSNRSGEKQEAPPHEEVPEDTVVRAADAEEAKEK